MRRKKARRSVYFTLLGDNSGDEFDKGDVVKLTKERFYRNILEIYTM